MSFLFSSAATPDNIPITVMTYNVDMAMREEKVEQTKWIHREARVKALIVKYNADVVCLQEMRKLPGNLPVEEWLASFEKQGYKYVIAYRNPSDLAFGQATLYKKDKLFCTKSETKWLSDTPSIPSATDADGKQGYIVLGATFQHVVDQKFIEGFVPFIIWNVHLGLEEDVKTKSASVINLLVAKIRHYRSIPQLVCGDFNFFPDGRADQQRAILSNFLKDNGERVGPMVGAFTSQGSRWVEGTFVGYDHDDFKSDLKNMKSRLDHIWTTPAWNLREPMVLCTETMRETEPEELTTRDTPSDHLPLFAEFTLPRDYLACYCKDRLPEEKVPRVLWDQLALDVEKEKKKLVCVGSDGLPVDEAPPRFTEEGAFRALAMEEEHKKMSLFGPDGLPHEGAARLLAYKKASSDYTVTVDNISVQVTKTLTVKPLSPDPQTPADGSTLPKERVPPLLDGWHVTDDPTAFIIKGETVVKDGVIVSRVEETPEEAAAADRPQFDAYVQRAVEAEAKQAAPTLPEEDVPRFLVYKEESKGILTAVYQGPVSPSLDQLQTAAAEAAADGKAYFDSTGLPEEGVPRKLVMKKFLEKATVLVFNGSTVDLSTPESRKETGQDQGAQFDALLKRLETVPVKPPTGNTPPIVDTTQLKKEAYIKSQFGEKAPREVVIEGDEQFAVFLQQLGVVPVKPPTGEYDTTSCTDGCSS